MEVHGDCSSKQQQCGTLSHKDVRDPVPCQWHLKDLQIYEKDLCNLVPDVLANSTTDSDDIAVSETMNFFGIK